MKATITETVHESKTRHLTESDYRLIRRLLETTANQEEELVHQELKREPDPSERTQDGTTNLHARSYRLINQCRLISRFKLTPVLDQFRIARKMRGPRILPDGSRSK